MSEATNAVNPAYNAEERRRWAVELAVTLEGVKDSWSLVSAAQDIEAYLKGPAE